jgi:hypothetical protein
MTYKLENIKLALASILAFVLVVAPLIIGYRETQFAWGICFSAAALLTIKLFYECGKYTGALKSRSFTPPAK